MFGRFCRRSRIIYFVAFILLLYVIFRISVWFISDATLETCQISKQSLKNMLNLAVKADSVLEKLNFTHFICYGTLWGALRHSKMLPWKTNFDFCIFNEDILRLDEVFFRRQFSKQALKIDYDSANGVYLLTFSGARADDLVQNAVVNMYVFEELPEMKIFRRIGFKNRLLPPTSDNIGSFPSQLAKPPLAKIKLNDLMLPAPREGIEIQKYHYKEDWWTEVKPANCIIQNKDKKVV